MAEAESPAVARRRVRMALREAREVAGFTQAEIATALNLPLGTVKSRINRGRIELAKILRRMRVVNI